jgi:hypoxanthine phosphoribosyltransferase
MGMAEPISEPMPDTVMAAAELVLTAGDVEGGISRLADQIQPVVAEGNCLLMGVLTGGMFPLVRIAGLLDGDFLVDYCHATRYEGATEGSSLRWEREPGLSLEGRDVIIVDDILDAGITLAAVADYCLANGAATVRTAVLIIKDRDRPVGTPAPDYDAGLHVPDRYVFGCGMDVGNRWRHLTAVYALPETGRS